MNRRILHCDSVIRRHLKLRAHRILHQIVGNLFCVHTIMSSANGSSRLLVCCCCVTFISVLFFCVGFVRLELELRSHTERIVALEQEQKVNETVKDAPPLSEGKRLIKLRTL